MRSLYESLGLDEQGQPKPEGDDLPSFDASSPLTREEKTAARDLCRTIISSPQYRRSLVTRIVLGELPPALEVRLWDYAYGKPVERVAVDMNNGEVPSLETLQARAAALALAIQEAQEDERLINEDSPMTTPAATIN